jgi:hypothetical protein
MDPRFQPQNPSAYPPNNQGYNHQGPAHQNKYPTLASPQNPQNPQYNVPNQQYPQYNPQINPYSHQAGPAGYIPPAQYGNVQALQGQDVNSESFLHAAKMRELERGLDSCFIKCYQGWLWLIILCSSMSFFKTFVTLITGGESGQGLGYWIAGSLIYGLWSIAQSAFGLQGIYQKSLSKANVACFMMTIYLIPSLILELAVINWINSYVPPPNDDTVGIIYAIMYIVLFACSLHILIHVCVNMTGAFRVRKILMERREVEERMNNRTDGSIQA